MAISSLSRKRAEVAGEIETAVARVAQLRADLAHLDAAIRIMDPNAEPELIPVKLPRPKGCDWFGRGELARMVLDVLREAARPLSSTEIARAVLAAKGMEPGDVAALRRVESMVRMGLIRREGGSVERAGEGRGAGWRVVPVAANGDGHALRG